MFFGSGNPELYLVMRFTRKGIVCRVDRLICAILFVAFCSNAQSLVLFKKQGDLIFGMNFSQVSIESFEIRRPVGISYEYMLSKHVGIQGGFTATKNYFEFGTGTIFQLICAPYIVGNQRIGGMSFALFLLGSFEHTNLHIPLSRRLEVTPYLSFLRVRYHWQPDLPYSSYVFLSGVAGLKIQVTLTKKLEFASFIEGTHVYSERLKGWQAGINLGQRIYSRKR